MLVLILSAPVIHTQHHPYRCLSLLRILVETPRASLEERLLAQHKRFRQRPVSEGGHYFWEELPHIDMDYHLTTLTIDEQGDSEAALRGAVEVAVTVTGRSHNN